ncbi:MAG: DUF4124 domain-containing protein [Cycloclasticus sp.]|nr:DUF4124 domain-containing protein [Cycloclasticus sp.]MBQ0789621.1 DUF4124 domain-containing protein [Cycloclasticus sp.]
MFRCLIFCFIFFLSSNALAAIYKWTDDQGNTSYGQTPPRDKSLKLEKLNTKRSPSVPVDRLKSLQDSANEIAKSNAERAAANNKAAELVREKQRIAKECSQAKQALAALDLGGNRLYKDSEGNYSRLTQEDKSQQRQSLSLAIEETCH